MTDLSDPEIDWQALANAYGVPSVLVETAEAFAAEFQAALQAEGPRLIVASLRPPGETPPPRSVRVAPSTAPAATSAPATPVVAAPVTPPKDLPPLHLDPWKILENTATQEPSRLCLVQEETRMTYGEVHEMATSLGAYFTARGMGKNERIGAIVGNQWQLLPVHYAVAALRCALLNLNTRLSPDELAHIFCDSKPT